MKLKAENGWYHGWTLEVPDGKNELVVESPGDPTVLGVYIVAQGASGPRLLWDGPYREPGEEAG